MVPFISQSRISQRSRTLSSGTTACPPQTISSLTFLRGAREWGGLYDLYLVYAKLAGGCRPANDRGSVVDMNIRVCVMQNTDGVSV